MKFTVRKTVSPCDTDLNSRPFPSFYLRCMQEAAHMHMTAYPPSPETLRDEHGRVFVLSRAVVSVYRELHACEEITVTTWASPTRGASFPRSVELRSAGELIAKLSSIWALVDTEKHGICRPEEYPCSYSTEPPLETELPLRFRIPRDAEFELWGEYTPTYADIDLNRHVNNTRYPDIMLGAIPEIQKAAFKSFGISYLHEAYAGEPLKIYTASTNDGIFLRSVRPDGQINIEMQVVI